MKKLLLFLLLSIPCFAFAQDTTAVGRLPIDPVTKLITYSKKFKFNNVKKDSLFTKVKRWVNYTYRAQSSPIQSEDYSIGRIMARGQKSFTMIMKAGMAGDMPVPATISYILYFNIADNECNVVIDSFANNYNGNALPVEQVINMYKTIKQTKTTTKMLNDIATYVNEIGLNTLNDLSSSLL